MNEKIFDSLLGNVKIKKYIKECIDRDVLPHTLIVSGPSGSGKSGVAKILSLSLACTSEVKPCLACPMCKKVADGMCPDIMTVLPKKGVKSIGVDAIRTVKDDAYITPNDLDLKIYIIPDAQTLTVAAQNAFLKLLEEPPTNAYFFLLCDSPGALLPTVRSRAQELKMQLFTRDEMQKLLIENSAEARNMPPDELSHAITRSAGSYGVALSLVESRTRDELYSSAKDIVLALSGTSRANFVTKFAAASSKRESLSELCFLLASAFRDMLAVSKSRTASPIFFASTDEASELAYDFTAKALCKMYDISFAAATDAASININAATGSLVTANRLFSAKSV